MSGNVAYSFSIALNGAQILPRLLSVDRDSATLVALQLPAQSRTVGLSVLAAIDKPTAQMAIGIRPGPTNPFTF